MKVQWKISVTMVLPTFLLVILHVTPCIQSLNFVSGREKQCFTSKTVPEKKLFYHNGKQREVRVLISSRPESRLIGSVFSIFAESVLGYQVSLTTSQMGDISREFDLDTQFREMSSCGNKFCGNLGSVSSSSPHTMMTLDMWLPPSLQVDTWDLSDTGQLGPAIRFGWFMPNRSASALHLSDHWKRFQNPEFSKNFKPDMQQMEFIKLKMRQSDGRFYCTAIYCSDEGFFTPEVCKQTGQECGVLLAGYPSSSSLYDSSNVVSQITDSGLLLQVAFLGPNLEEVVDSLDTEDSGGSFLVLHYAPSTLVLRHQLVPVMFPQCKDPLLQRHSASGMWDPYCHYVANRMAKVVWRQVQDEAPMLYRLVEHFGFSHKQFINLLEFYNMQLNGVSKQVDFKQLACDWLHQKEGHQTRFSKMSPEWNKPTLYIGGIFPISGTKYRAPELAAVARMAVDDINLNSNVLATHELKLDINDGKCEADVVMKRFIDIIKTKDTHRFRSTVGMLGPACSDTVEPIAGVSKHFRTVVISYSAEGSISNDNSKEYPYFFRTIAENKQYKFAYIETLRKLGWSKVAALTQDGQKYSDYMSSLQDEFQANEIEFVMNRKFPKEATDMKMYLEDLKERGAKIIIGEFYASSARLILCEAFNLGMTQKQGYVWFLPGWFEDRWYDIDHLRSFNSSESSSPAISLFPTDSQKTTINYNSYSNVGALPDCNTSQMLEAINGHLSLVHSNFAEDTQIPDNYTVSNDGKENTVGAWKKRTLKVMCDTRRNFEIITRRNSKKNTAYNLNDVRNCSDPKDLEDVKLNKYSGYVYDAVWLYAKALNTLISQSGKSYIQNLHSDRTVEEFVNIIKKMDFEGVSGRINFRGRPSRLSNIRIEQWRQKKTNLQPYGVGIYKPNYEIYNENMRNISNGKMIKWKAGELSWQTEDGSKPLDNPKECGVLSAFATDLDIECQLAITMAFIIGFAILLVFILIIFLILKRRYELKMKATEDRMRALGLLNPMSALTLDEWEIPRDRVVINRKLGEGAFGMVYGGESFFDEKGWVAVAVKTLKVGSNVEEKIDFLSEAEMMKRFDHRNIVKLLGVCTRNEPVYTVMEFMLYGDLKTYLLARRHLVNERNREDLDEVSNKRLTSMAYDIAKGLEYLADLKYVHRDIACRNCLVNSGRTVKLGDFGMTRPMFESDYYRFSKKGMLPVRWMSPESLSDGLFTPMSDIWSYGVLLYEMVTFGSFPFQGLSNNQVLAHVKSGNTLNVPQGIKTQMGLLLKACWNQTPTKRPSAGEIVELFFNNPRMVSPCIDVPLASVQIERTDSLEMIPKSRKASDLQQNKLRVGPTSSNNKLKELVHEADPGYGSEAYSPMIVPYSEAEHSFSKDNCVHEPLLENTTNNEMEGDIERSVVGSSPGYSLGEQSPYSCSPFMDGQLDAVVGSYVPSGYIVLDHAAVNGDYPSNFHSKHSVSSL